MIEEKSFLIDPLTCLCKLALLNLMPEQTKISVYKNTLYIQEYTYYQCIERAVHQDSRLDIANLVIPLIKSLKWYVLDSDKEFCKQLSNQDKQNILIIATHAIQGIRQLKVTYDGDYNVINNLQYFINLIRNAINNTWNEDDLIRIDNASEAGISDRIKNNYNSDSISIISQILINSSKQDCSKQQLDTFIRCLINLLDEMDTTFKKLIKDLTKL